MEKIKLEKLILGDYEDQFRFVFENYENGSFTIKYSKMDNDKNHVEFDFYTLTDAEIKALKLLLDSIKPF